MSNVYDFFKGQEPASHDRREPPDNGGMEARVAKLEEFAQDVRDRLARIETRLDGLNAVFATKDDLHRELHAQTWRFIGAVTTLGIAIIGAMVWIAKNVT